MTSWPEVLLGEILIERKEKPPFEGLLTGEIPIILEFGKTDFVPRL